MKTTLLLSFAIVLSFSCADDKHKYYEKGLLDGAIYTIEFNKCPSVWHRQVMHSMIDSTWFSNRSRLYEKWLKIEHHADSIFRIEHPEDSIFFDKRFDKK